MGRMYCFSAAGTSQFADAGIIGSTVGNDDEAIDWLESQGYTGLTLLAKQNIAGSLEGQYKDGFSLNSDDAGRANAWTYDNTSVSPKFWAVKFANLVAIYECMGPGTSPFSDGFDLDADFFNGSTLLVDIDYANGLNLIPAGDYSAGDAVFDKQTNGLKNLNLLAGTSHVSVYGMTTPPPPTPSPFLVPEPTSALFWLGAVALTGVSRRRRR